MNIGENIKNARCNKGISQADLARAIGATKSTISKYELGHRQPSLETIQKIANALKISTFDLVGIPIDAEMVERFMRDPKHAITFETDEYIGIKSRSDLIRYRKDYLLYKENSERLKTAFDKLNETGQEKAVDYVSDLAENPKYTKKE